MNTVRAHVALVGNLLQERTGLFEKKKGSCMSICGKSTEELHVLRLFFVNHFTLMVFS